jgi:hypothetical protein
VLLGCTGGLDEASSEGHAVDQARDTGLRGDIGLLADRLPSRFAKAASNGRPRPRSRVRATLAGVVAGAFIAVLLVGLWPANLGASLAGSLRVGGLAVSPDLSSATIRLEGDSGAIVADDKAQLAVRNDALEVPLRFVDNGAPQVVTLNVTSGVERGTITLNYFPPSYYAKIGSDLKGVLLLDTTFPRVDRVAVGDGMHTDLRSEDVPPSTAPKWDEARAAGVAPAFNGDVAAAVRNLYLLFNRSNDPDVGRLCSEQATGIDTLYGVTSGACYVWCTGYALMLRGFLRASGIPARYVELDPQEQVLPNGLLVASSESHATVEWWDGHQWAWIGPTSRSLRATGPQGNPLSVAELISFMAAPSTRNAITFTRLDAATGTWTTRPYADQDQDFKNALQRDFTSDKTVVGTAHPTASMLAATNKTAWLWVIGAALTGLAAMVVRIRRRRSTARLTETTRQPAVGMASG